MCSIRIGGEQAEYFALTVDGREPPRFKRLLGCELADLHGRDRRLATSTVASIQASAPTNSSGSTNRSSSLNQRLIGDAELTTMEDWLTLRLSGDHRGHVRVSCRLFDDRAAGNLLECHLAPDQTYLKPLLRQLAEVLGKYPVVYRQG